MALRSLSEQLLLDSKCSELFKHFASPEQRLDFHKAVMKLVVGVDKKDKGFFLTYDQGKQVQEILSRYLNEELMPSLTGMDEIFLSEDQIEELNRETQKDISYIKELIKLFD